MASLPELRNLCTELGIESEGLLIDEMKQQLRETFDEVYKTRSMTGSSQFSKEMIKFITEEYDYLLRDKDGNRKYYKDL